MPEPLDTLEIKISSSSTDAVDKVNALASALERLKKASSLKGIENTAEKIKAIGDFYVCMAKAFMDDPDAGEDKLAKYYEYIVK